MKLTKYLLFACSALVLASCGNDDDWNSASDVTVQMANATMRVKENGGLFNVPLEVVGKANGPIRVTVAVAAVEESPAEENVHYVLTSNTVVIPDNDTQVSLEFDAKNDMDINDDRLFVITIVNAEGARIGEQNSTEVTIRDDDSIFYEALQGTWTFSDVNFFDDTEESYKMTIVGVEEGNELYENILYLSGFAGRSNLVAEVGYNYDEATKTITLEIEYGQTLGQLKFSVGDCDIVLCGVNGNSLATSGTAVATVSADLRTIEFDPAEILYLAVFQGSSYLGGFDGFTNMIMKR